MTAGYHCLPNGLEHQIPRAEPHVTHTTPVDIFEYLTLANRAANTRVPLAHWASRAPIYLPIR